MMVEKKMTARCVRIKNVFALGETFTTASAKVFDFAEAAVSQYAEVL